MPNVTVPAAAAGLPNSADVEELRMRLGVNKLRRLRADLAREIERLIETLDVLDGDPDLEDDGTAEPWLGAPERDGRGYWSRGDHNADDRELDDEREDDPAELGIGDMDGLREQTTLGEPDLGATSGIDQERAWALPDAEGWLVDDGEPELGWTDMESRYGRYGARDDREGDDERENDDERESDEAERGIADRDSLDDPEIYFGQDAGWDGSGRVMAEVLLRKPWAFHRF